MNTEQILSRIISEEVHTNCSAMVHELFTNGGDLYVDELLECTTTDDWESALDEHMANLSMLEQVQQSQEIVDYMGYDVESPSVWEEVQEEVDAGEDWQEVCDYIGIEPDQVEALEHWIVSPWLAGKLEDNGALVCDFYNVHIWGRTDSGQSLECNGDLQAIAQSLANH